MDMIRHDDRRVQVEGVLILMQAAIECDLASAVGKNPSMVCAEGQKMRLVVALQMGKIAPIKRLRHAHVGADALVCPAERSSALGIIARQQFFRVVESPSSLRLVTDLGIGCVLSKTPAG